MFFLCFRDVMQGQHVDPEEAVEIHQDVQAKRSVAIHWGTFALANEVIHTAKNLHLTVKSDCFKCFRLKLPYTHQQAL